jgi:dihydrofolate reductase
MSLITCHVSISVDGFIAGPDQSRENPIGVGGLKLHQWHAFAEDGPIHEGDAAARDDLMRTVGAVIMGRNMYGPIRGEWDDDWRGWWGDNPPYHSPVFVLTHYPHEPIVMDGGTTFYFVTGGFDAALDQARDTAAGGDIRISGGASTIRQAFAAGVIDEITLDIGPALLGSGERIFDGIEDPGFEQVGVTYSPSATHVHYRVTRDGKG